MVPPYCFHLWPFTPTSNRSARPHKFRTRSRIHMRLRGRWKGKHQRLAKQKADEAAAEEVTPKERKQGKLSVKQQGMKFTAPPKTKVDCYATKVLENCTGIRKRCMEYRFFADAMHGYHAFRHNFCLSPTRFEELKQKTDKLNTVYTALDTTLLGMVNQAAHDGSPGSPRVGDFSEWGRLGQREWKEADPTNRGWVSVKKVHKILRHVPSAAGRFRSSKDRTHTIKKMSEDPDAIYQNLSTSERAIAARSSKTDVCTKAFDEWWAQQPRFTVQKFKLRLEKLTPAQIKDWSISAEEKEEDSHHGGGDAAMERDVAEAVLEAMWYEKWNNRRDKVVRRFHDELVKRIIVQYDPARALTGSGPMSPNPKLLKGGTELRELAQRCFDDWDVSKDGVINEEELWIGLQKIGHYVTEESSKQMNARTLHVSGLVDDVSNVDLEEIDNVRDFFGAYGTVLVVTMRTDRKTEEGRMVSWAFITFATEASAENVLKAAEPDKLDPQGDSQLKRHAGGLDLRVSRIDNKLLRSSSKEKKTKAQMVLDEHHQRLQVDANRQRQLAARLMDHLDHLTPDDDKEILIDREEFVGFVCQSDSLLKDNTAALTSREYPHRRKNKEEEEKQKSKLERRWDWDWDMFETKFDDWWETKNPVKHSDGSETISMKKEFLPFWMSDEVSDEMRDGAVRRVHWHATLKCATHLWKQYDTNSSGYIPVGDAKKMLARIVSPDGHLLSKKTIREQQKKRQGQKRQGLHAQSESYRMRAATEKLVKLTTAGSSEDGASEGTGAAALISQAAFFSYWSDTVFLVKEFTIKYLELEELWEMLGNGRGDLQPWQAKALLATVWNENMATQADKTACEFCFTPPVFRPDEKMICLQFYLFMFAIL
eukprot:COSAG05_NODE_402_length_10229_cov_3.609674_3_plen_878_part_00